MTAKIRMGPRQRGHSKTSKAQTRFISSGHIFASRAEPLKQLFIDAHLPPDFHEQLNAAVGDIEKAIMNQVFKEGIRIAATSAVNEACTAALSALDRLNPLMENLLRSDAPTLRLWQSARHIERYTASRRTESGAAASEPPITTNDAVAAQA